MAVWSFLFFWELPIAYSSLELLVLRLLICRNAFYIVDTSSLLIKYDAFVF